MDFLMGIALFSFSRAIFFHSVKILSVPQDFHSRSGKNDGRGKGKTIRKTTALVSAASH